MRRLASCSVLEERPQLLAAARVTELAQRLRLDLADALACDVELLADSFYCWQGCTEGACLSGARAASDMLADVKAGRV